MKQNILNTTGSNPNYLNTSTTSREVSFNEITPTEGNLSEALKNFKVIFEDDFYLGDDTTVFAEFVIANEDEDNLPK